MKIINCNICGSKDMKEILRGYDRNLHKDKTMYSLVRCGECSLVYMNPQPTLSELKKYYPSEYQSYSNNFEIFDYSGLAGVLRTFSDKFLKKPAVAHTPAQLDLSEKTILDFGCGSGRMLLSLQKNHPNWKLYGFDISTNTEIKKINANFHIYYDDFSKIKSVLPREAFDYIYLNNVLEHLNTPRETLTDLAGLLKEGGEIKIMVPNIDCLKFKIFKSYFFNLEIPRHLYHFNPQTIEKLCSLCNLKIKSVDYGGSTVSTILSLNYILNREGRQINPITYRFFDLITKLAARVFGENRINNESMVIVATK